MNTDTPLLKTPLFDLHQQANAKIVPFAGYEMPVSYPLGIIKEHLHTREKAGLFDVSHMGQVAVRGDNIAELLETLIPVDIQSLDAGRQKYGLFLDDQGGILDDLMIINRGEDYVLVVNAACKEADLAHLQKHLGDRLDISMMQDHALLALQGPTAGAVMERLGQDIGTMKFMDVREMTLNGAPCLVSRSGYTGEDGFEISVPNDQAMALAEHFLADEDVELIGLGARDSLRLEAGLCLYGHDITTDTTPIEASLNWAISPARRANGERAGGFPGADTVLPQIPKNVSRRLVGLTPEGRAPVREGTELIDSDHNVVGFVTSGGFSPSLGHPISMGYVSLEHAGEATELLALVRNKQLPVKVSKMPFVSHRYYR